MEYFILGAVGRLGLGSLYDLRREVGLEPGAARSAMRLLEARELLFRNEPGKRRRRELTLSPAGTALLDHSWTDCLREYSDADAVLRAALVAWTMGGPAATAAYLQQVGQARDQSAQHASADAEHLKRSQTEPLSGYVWMRASLEAHRRSAESQAFLAMSGLLKEHFSNHARP